MGTNLYEKILKFKKMAEEVAVSVQKNTDPTLKELSDLRTFDERIEFCKSHFKFLGEGSSRTAFEIDKDTVIKVAHNDKGIAQIKVEMDPETQRACTNPVMCADADGKWILIRNTKPLTKERFKEIVGFGFEPFMNALFYKFNNESDRWAPPRDYKEIEKNELFVCLAELVFATDQQLGDATKISSYRELDGKVVLADYGLSRDTYKKYYKDTSTSTSKSSPPKSST